MQIDGLIIGGGVIGLALGKRLVEEFPDFEFALFETQPYVGECSSSRNSGVMHAGIYYPQNSLKHIHCLKGRELWKEWAQELEIDLNPCGKVIFSTTSEEEQALMALYQNGIQNGVQDLQLADKIIMEKISPYVDATKAIFSPNTGSIDLAGALKSLENYLFNKNIPILLENTVTSIEKTEKGFKVTAGREEMDCRFLFNCAGRDSLGIRHQLGLTDLNEKLVKGHYLRYNADYFSDHLLYPMPLKDLKGLGIHTCLDGEGKILFGPDAKTVTDYSFQFTEEDVADMREYVLKTYKGIDPEKLSLDYSGIRNKLIYQGKDYLDFWLGDPESTRIEGYFEACGIESPGFTSAPSISEFIGKKLRNYL